MNNKISKAFNTIKSPKIVAGVTLALLAIIGTACTPKAAASIKATWIEAPVSGKTVTIPASDIEKNGIVHFRLALPSGTESFMAYNLGGKTYARANVCPPCRSINFSLVGDTLVCDSCGTVFDAKTGEGKSGACVNFPKADVNFQIENGKLVMNADNMDTAYQNTLAPGRP